jgi:hypothetical protein
VIFRNRILFLRYQCYLIIIMNFLCWCNVLRWIWCLWCYSECISTPDKLEKYSWIEPTTFGILYPFISIKILLVIQICISLIPLITSTFVFYAWELPDNAVITIFMFLSIKSIYLKNMLVKPSLLFRLIK